MTIRVTYENTDTGQSDSVELPNGDWIVLCGRSSTIAEAMWNSISRHNGIMRGFRVDELTNQAFDGLMDAPLLFQPIIDAQREGADRSLTARRAPTRRWAPFGLVLAAGRTRHYDIPCSGLPSLAPTRRFRGRCRVIPKGRASLYLIHMWVRGWRRVPIGLLGSPESRSARRGLSLLVAAERGVDPSRVSSRLSMRRIWRGLLALSGQSGPDGA